MVEGDEADTNGTPPTFSASGAEVGVAWAGWSLVYPSLDRRRSRARCWIASRTWSVVTSPTP